ncbi:dihydrofolate reductase family protein [Spirosoma flavus]
MRTIRIMAHVTLDGVIQHENSEGFAYGNWSMPYLSSAGLEAVIKSQGNSFDLLLGRHTYNLWVGYWPNAGDTPIANGINNATKYVATHRPDTLEWGPVKALGSDILASIREIKSTEGPDLIVWGSSTLTSVLLDQGLADEVVLLVYPVLLGRGKRFFSDSVDPCKLSFVSTQVTPTGVLINTYRPAGSLRL